ncbi:glycosyltransferase family 4 protein [Rhizobium sp. BR 315]|uniref:glycosyltransferase family 4 protein n=1 Tax=Rhizobium sp. BR 315 TaxID=3040014 RepID=UPI003D325A11
MSQQNDIFVTMQKPRPRLAYIVTEDWFFVTHFLPLARAARDNCFDVIVITQVNGYSHHLEAEGFKVVPLTADRSSFGIASLLKTIARMRTIIRSEQPDIIHAIALKSVILGGLASVFAGRPAQIFSLTGLGYLWIESRFLVRLARSIVRHTLKLLGANSRTIFTFENEDDAREFGSLKNAVVIGGWGIASDHITPMPGPRLPPMRIVYLGRMLRAKGIELAVRAVQLARSTVDVQLELWGTPDEGNLTSYTKSELEAFSQLDGIQWCGRCNDASDAWRRADVAILLSEREGMPRSLIEAAAAGLPMIASDVPGCRSIVRDGENGFLVPRGDVKQVAAAIVKLVQSTELRVAMGRAARRDFEARFSTEKVIPRFVGLYLSL